MTEQEKLVLIGELIAQLISDGMNIVEVSKTIDSPKAFDWRMHATCLSLEIAHHQAVDSNRIANALEELVRR